MVYGVLYGLLLCALCCRPWYLVHATTGAVSSTGYARSGKSPKLKLQLLPVKLHTWISYVNVIWRILIDPEGFSVCVLVFEFSFSIYLPLVWWVVVSRVRVNSISFMLKKHRRKKPFCSNVIMMMTRYRFKYCIIQYVLPWLLSCKFFCHKKRWCLNLYYLYTWKNTFNMNIGYV